MQLTLTRDPTRSNANGTFGELAIDGVHFCQTVEQPWANNIPDHSCVPPGTYQLIPYDSQSHGKTVVLHNPALGIYGTQAMIPAGETGRTYCEIHVANWPSDVKGCIGVGSGYSANLAPHGPAVTGSGPTFTALQAKWGDRSNLTLTIA
jgi:hypothetical protein